MCQGFGHFSGFLHHFVLAELAISSIRVNQTAAILTWYKVCLPQQALSNGVKIQCANTSRARLINTLMPLYFSSKPS